MAEAPRPGWIDSLPARIEVAGHQYFRQFAPPHRGVDHAAVLMLFGPNDDGGEDVLLTQRARELRAHPGQVSFPGGRIDPEDDGPVAAALREANEEVGVDAAGVDVVASLPPIYMAPSALAVTPVLAWWSLPAPVQVVSSVEVARVVRVRVAELTDPTNRFMATTPGGYVSAGFEVDGLFIWGFTAKLLDTLLDAADVAPPWDEQRHRPLPRAVLESWLAHR